jgi:hypothetical protein
MLKKEDAYKNILLLTSSLMEDEDVNIYVALTKCFMGYTGRDADGKETCKILTFDETCQPLINKR